MAGRAVTDADLVRLMCFYGRYERAGSRREHPDLVWAQGMVRALLERDYEVETVDNARGQLCSTYPLELLILRSERGAAGAGPRTAAPVGKLLGGSSRARVWSRLPVPVLLVDGKHVCRSATLSNSMEVAFKAAKQWVGSVAAALLGGASQNAENSEASRTLDEARDCDVRLLKALDVDVICDLMVEERKMKLGGALPVCSSEKVDRRRRYRDFTIVPTPYPGCEFFTDYCRTGSGAGLVFDWDDDAVTSVMGVRELCVLTTHHRFPFDWSDYRAWDLDTLTRRYVQLFLCMLQSDSVSGMLVHCISGWDRTPLFVSLLRMVLWCQGKAHRSLAAHDMLYLTIAYDWLLFSHQLAQRESRDETIFAYCFRVLQACVAAATAPPVPSPQPSPPTSPALVPVARSDPVAIPRNNTSTGGDLDAWQLVDARASPDAPQYACNTLDPSVSPPQLNLCVDTEYFTVAAEEPATPMESRAQAIERIFSPLYEQWVRGVDAVRFEASDEFQLWWNSNAAN